MSSMTRATFLKDGVVFCLETPKSGVVAYLDDVRDFSGRPVFERWTEGRVKVLRLWRLVIERERQT